jgi:hypothetical protein
VHTISTSNGAHGFYADSGSILDLDDSVSSGNVNGITSISGGLVRMSNTTVTNNGGGVVTTMGSQILSYGNNRITGNYSNNAPTGMVTLQ